MASCVLFCAGCDRTVQGRDGAEELEQQFGFTFVDVTESSVLSGFRHETGAEGKVWMPESMGSGCGFIDYDGDGWQDLLLVGGGRWTPGDTTRALRLYRNKGDGTFQETTDQAGLGHLRVYGFGVTVADYDNDGDQDFYFTTLRENSLFRNDGGRFVDVAEEAGVTGKPEWSSSAVFFDADRDGWLDLYVANYVEWTPETDVVCSLDGVHKSYCTPDAFVGIPGRFYRNNGDGTFTDRTVESGLYPSPGKALGVAQFDYNDDGWPDLVVANDTQRNLLYKNNRDGTFSEIGITSGIAFDENGKARAGMGVDTGVIDSTGRETIVIGNFSNEMTGVFQYTGGDLFTDRAAVSRIGHTSLNMLTFSVFLFDPDLDGDLDLLAANGHIDTDIGRVENDISYEQYAQLYLNTNGRFQEVGETLKGAFLQKMVGRGAAYADYDRDGDQDVLIAENGGRAFLWRNDTSGRHFLRVGLIGKKNNRAALGARLIGYVAGKPIYHRIRSGSSFLSSSETTATFGLGTAEQVDSLIVLWPNGQKSRLGSIKADQEIWIVEGEPEFEQRWKSATFDHPI